MTAMHWNAMSEAANLRLTQQKTTKKFLNLHFGHEIAVSDKKCPNTEDLSSKV